MIYDSGREPEGTASDLDGDHWYGRDCSGMIAMAWHLPPGRFYGLTTRNMMSSPLISQIERNELRPGDALLRPGHHVVLFEAWQDAVRLTFSYFSFGSTPMRHYNGQPGERHGPLGSFDADGEISLRPANLYIAVRYQRVVDDS